MEKSKPKNQKENIVKQDYGKHDYQNITRQMLSQWENM